MRRLLLCIHIFFNLCVHGQVVEFPLYFGPGCGFNFDSSSIPDAVKKVSAHLLKFPKDTSALYHRAQLKLNSTDANSSLLDFYAVLDLSRTNIRKVHSSVYIGIGEALNLLKNYEKAVRYFDTAIYLNSFDKTSAMLGKAIALESIGKFDAALELLNSLIDLHPQTLDFYSKRGDFYLRRGENQAALSDYESAMLLFRKSSLLFSHGGTEEYLLLKQSKVKFNLEKYQSAIDDLAILLERDSLNLVALESRARNYEKMKLYHLAMQDYNRIIEANTSSDYAYFARGSLKSNLGDNLGAKLDYDKAIQLNSSDDLYYFFRSFTLEELGKLKEALMDMNYAIKLNEKDPFYFYQRGWQKKKLGNLSGACLDWSKAGEMGYMKAYQTIKDNCK